MLDGTSSGLWPGHSGTALYADFEALIAAHLQRSSESSASSAAAALHSPAPRALSLMSKLTLSRATSAWTYIYIYIYIYVDVQGEGTPATIRNLQNLVTTHSAEWRYRQFEMKRNIRGVLYSTSKQGGFARLSSTGDTGLNQLHLRKISHKSARTLPANHEITTRLRSHCVAAFAGCNDDTYKP